MPVGRRLASALLAVAACALACPGTMREREGHRIFNPFYRVFLDAPDRERWQQPDQVIEALALPPGAAVADVGAGTGYFTERLSRAVGPGGRVFATDVQPEMIRALEERVVEQDLRNVSVVRAGFDDPSLPPGCCDLVFLANVYKEIDDRVAYLRRVAPALRPGGRVAIVDFRPDAEGLGPPREVRLSEDVVRGEMAGAGFAQIARFDFLPRQYFLVFGPAPEPSPHP